MTTKRVITVLIILVILVLLAGMFLPTIGIVREMAHQHRPRPVPIDGTPMARDLGDGANGERLGDPLKSDRRDPQWPVYENPFVKTREPGGDASTFAADVDSASYNVIRSQLSDMDQMPLPSEVRIEELINRFAYSYDRPEPGNGPPFRILPEVVTCPWKPEHHIVRIGISSRGLEPAARPAMNLVFLIDISGSMQADNRLPLVKESLSLLVEGLTANDRVAIVTYASGSGIILDPTPGDQHDRILDRKSVV